MKLYTKDQIERACRQAGDSFYWRYFEGGSPDGDDVVEEVLDNLQALEELEPVTEVNILSGKPDLGYATEGTWEDIA